MTKEISEERVRKLRARIYGECSNDNWIACRDNWMREDSVEWLENHQPKRGIEHKREQATCAI